ncbi:hypothetical protein DSL72_000585 [Monilinia vaccinii-corymbosi]|uniref:Palmitoyltransferase n=1 Tax=Monilinia vaccinii-corymbosi TaxID=61207 RepID=A0A8A3P4J9_9HELO|nr:hypothetical protein DSL72_000585 [Monilinia vaccinii-corymbosi]
MTSRDNSPSKFLHSTDTDNYTFPNLHLALSELGDGVSVLSSRMTDIASEDGDNTDNFSNPGSHGRNLSQCHSIQTGDGASRPDTGATVVSSRGTFGQAASPRRGYISGTIAQRGSTLGQVPSSTSKTHIPSLNSHTFFRPLSSQRLQAQRGGSRPAMAIQQGFGEDGSLDGGSVRQSVNSNITIPQRTISEDADLPAPPSRGTEVTEIGTVDRGTANTSPIHGHAAGSLTDSVRPLQNGPASAKRLSLNIDKAYKNGTSTPKSPRSFHSNFLMPARNDGPAGSPSPSRSNQGREKLSSAASSPDFALADAQRKDMQSPNLGKNHQYFTGNTVFCWGGRLQNTRHRPINIATGLFVLVPSILFFVFSAPFLWHHISPAVPILYAYIFYLCMSSFIHASVSDPGILPRNLHPMPPADENEDPLRLAPPQNDWTMIKSAQSTTAAMEVPTKYCKTCNIWRPPRGHHCRVCDNCIETQDHHCVWLNNCVGRRNYRYFFAFVSSGTLLGTYLFSASIAQIIVYSHQQHISFCASISHCRVPFAMFIYGLLATPYPAALMAYHFFLMGRGETTREYLNSHKFIKKDRHRPFTQGSFISNWITVLCRPRPPTYLSFKRKYEEGDQRFGERRGKQTAPLTKEFQGGSNAMELQNVNTAEGEGFQGPASLRPTTSGVTGSAGV